MKLPQKKNNPTIQLESQLLTQGFTSVVGIDEAGRGSWAGPVVVAAFRYDLSLPVDPAVKDSKLISAKVREKIFSKLQRERFHYCFGLAARIDGIGIGNVITELISELIQAYSKDQKVYFLIDGQFKQDFGSNSSKLIHGDLKHYAISVASVVAKVVRDRALVELDTMLPEYGFKIHKGYGTKMHSEALARFGISPVHRRSYAPMRSLAGL